MRLTFTRIRHLVLICLLLAIQVIIIAQDSPTRLTINEPVSGTLGDGNVTDIYEFEGTANGVLTITVTSEELSYGLLLKDAEGNTVSEAIADDDGVISLEDVLLTNTGSYLITIFSTGDEGDYEITILIEGSDTLAVEPEPSDPPASTGNFVTELPDVADVLVNSGMEVRLQWSAAVDLNLEVRDPRGNTLFFNNRQSPIGGSFGFDANGVCDVISDAPVETATWQPGFLPAGSYEILVFYRQNCTDSNLSVPFTVTVTYNGNVLEAIEGDIPPPINDNTDSVYVANFTVQDESTATVNQGGQYPDTALQNLPATTVELQGQAVPIERNVPITGALFEEQDFVVYSFEAEANENITVTMTATSRNLDTLLQLVGPNGNLLSVNDDSNGTTNSTITNQRIVQSGTYLLVATRYGKEVGGTEGEFSLVVTESTGSLPDSVANLVVPEGDIQVFLTWNNNTDLQLLVRDPLAAAVYDDEPQITSGGILAENGNVGCTVSEGDPLSYIYWPNGLLRPGTYEVDVWFENQCNDTSLVEFDLTVVVNGEVIIVQRQTPAIGQRFVTNFTINPDGTVDIGEANFIGRGITLADIENEPRVPISPSVPVTGSITLDNDFDVYTFSATAGQIVTIAMETPASNLDSHVFLLNSAGIQVFDNDDAPEGSFVGTTERSTDSLISGFTIPADGEYLIIASRYGKNFGGTLGSYQLTLQVSQ